MKSLLLGIDLGTTALKAVVFDYHGNQIADSGIEYSLESSSPDFVEVDPEVYWDSLKAALSQLNQQCNLKEVTAIGFSAQGETMFFMDENGQPLRKAIVWMDNRAKEEAVFLREKFTNDVCYQTCGQISFEPCWPASKVLWVKKHEPDIFNRTKKVILIEDYFIYRMSGIYVSECSLLTSTTYWNITTKKYWPEMLETIGLTENQLPEIRESGEVVGPLLPHIAEELGLSPKAVVCTGALDQASGAIGVGNIREGLFSENIGAAMAICVLTPQLTFDPNKTMPVHYFPLPDRYMMHTFTSGGMNLRWFRDNFCQIEAAAGNLAGMSAFSLLDKEAASVPAGCDGMIMLPHLSGSMAPDMNSNAKGVFYGFSLGHKKAHFARAIMEALGFILMRNLDALEAMGISVTEIRSLGGGARSSFWNQLKADMTGRRLITMRCKEAASLGAAILAGKALGVFDTIEQACEDMVQIDKVYEPDNAYREIYDNAYFKYKKLFLDLTEVFELK